MDDLDGPVYCDYTKWTDLVASFSGPQRARFSATSLRTMLQLLAIGMRTNLIRFMIELFDPKTEKFVIQDKAGEIAATL
jgi:hypothetical protein